MTRRKLWEPPAHLASAFHTHTCSRVEHEYPCYAANHTPGSVRPCGSPSCKEVEQGATHLHENNER